MQSAVSDTAIRTLFVFIAILSIIGAILSAVSLQRHYAKSDTNFCDFSQKFSCDIVNRSEYSEVAGIPVAGIGVAGYIVLFLFSTLWKSRSQTPTRLLAAAAAGLLFALYLTYVEAYELETWCILCLASLLVIFLLTVAAAIVKLRFARG
jgi:vitamin-K-epoxide reductase (warfarin-sensitive)